MHGAGLLTTIQPLGGRVKISYLINDMYGIGGTVRTVANQAAALSARHEVEIVSIFQHRAEPILPLPPKVRLRPLVDVRQEPSSDNEGGALPLHEGAERAELPPELFPPEDSRSIQHSLFSDDRLAEYLATTDADIVVGTRPGLNVAIARAAPDHLIKVGQEHLVYEQHSDALRRIMRETYPALDAFVTVTEADARTYSVRMPLPGVLMRAIPNSVPRPSLISDGSNTRTIVAAGRLAPSKRHDLLVDAFATVADDHPDWVLRIYGKGNQRARLVRKVHEHGLEDRVWLMGPHPRVEEAWAQGAFAAASSSGEAFGMTIVEAMRSGLPVVSTDCPHGPASIISNREDGILVPNRSVSGIASGLAELMGNETKRRSMAEAALKNSERFDPARVVRMHEGLFEELMEAKAGPGSMPFPPKQTESNVLAPNTEATVPKARSTTARVHPGPATGAGADALRAPAPSTDTEPTCRVWATAENGVATLEFTTPPTRMLLTSPSEQMTFVPDQNGTVVLDPGREHLAPRTWQVRRVDVGPEGEQNTPVEDVEIHQNGYPLEPAHTKDLALILPTRSAKGRLQLHVRRSPAHAEIEHVKVAGELITVRGHVLAHDDADARARLALRLRSSPRTVREFSAPVVAGGEFTSVVDPVVLVHGRHGESEKWELVLVLSDGTECTVGRHLAGVAGYKKIIEYPSVDVVPQRACGSRVQPYYTINDRLGVITTPTPPTLGVDSVRVRPSGRYGDRITFDVRLDGPLPAGTEYAVEVVRGVGAGQRFPLHGVPGREAPQGAGGPEGAGVSGEPSSATIGSTLDSASGGHRELLKRPRSRRHGARARLIGTVSLLDARDRGGGDPVHGSWQVRLLVGPPGALEQLNAPKILGGTSRRWSHGSVVRSATVVPLRSGDLRVTVADVRVLPALWRRMYT